MQAAAPGTPGALALRMRSNVTRSMGLPLRVGGLAGLALLAGCCSEPCYSLVVVGASLPAIDPSGRGCSTWDCNGATTTSNPDPYVVVSSSLDLDRTRTPELSDTLEPRWDDELGDDLTADELARPIGFDVYDRDPALFQGDDDPIAHFTLTLTREQVRPGRIVLQTPVGSQTATLTVEIR